MIVHFKPLTYTLRATPINEVSVYVSNLCVYPNKRDVSNVFDNVSDVLQVLTRILPTITSIKMGQ